MNRLQHYEACRQRLWALHLAAFEWALPHRATFDKAARKLGLAGPDGTLILEDEEDTDGSLRPRRGSGGLVTALSQVGRHVPVTWIAAAKARSGTGKTMGSIWRRRISPTSGSCGRATRPRPFSAMGPNPPHRTW